MEISEDKIYSQIYGLIQLVGKDYQEMLPDKVKKTIDSKRDKSYVPTYNINVPLEEQGIYKDSLAILSNIQYNYWCKTEEEKRTFLKELKQVDIDRENKLREMYNPDNIFKRNIENKNGEKQEIAALTEINNDTLISKIIKIFNKLFKRITKK